MLERLAFGPTRRDVDHLRSVGFDAWLDEQLAPDDAADPEVTRRLAGFETELLSAHLLRPRFANAPETARNLLQLAELVRATYSRWQLRERLVELWSDHFSIDSRVGHGWFLLPVHQRDVIRRHALGRFADLLAAVTASPAMLHYLDNWVSRRDHPNENHARELLELHTVGVDGGYDETTVAAVARLLTGWTYETANKPTRYEFLFRPGWHDDGPVDALGWRSGDATGLDDGAAFVDHLAHHPATARFVAGRLARRFVADEPSPALVDHLAGVYLANDTAIAPVVGALVATDEFWASAGAKTRRPVDTLVATLRALDADIDTVDRADTARQLVWRLRAAGHAPFEWATPDGYPDHAGAWLHTNGLLTRWNLVTDVAYDRIATVQVPWELHGALAPATAADHIDHWFALLRFRRPTPIQRDALLAAIGAGAGDQLTSKQATAVRPLLVTLVVAEPGAQLR